MNRTKVDQETIFSLTSFKRGKYSKVAMMVVCYGGGAKKIQYRQSDGMRIMSNRRRNVVLKMLGLKPRKVAIPKGLKVLCHSFSNGDTLLQKAGGAWGWK